jgi:hypothetical protein
MNFMRKIVIAKLLSRYYHRRQKMTLARGEEKITQREEDR